MEKTRNRGTLRISAGLLSASVLLLLYVYLTGMSRAIHGYAVDAQATGTEHLFVLYKPFLMYFMAHWPLVLLYTVLLAASVIFFFRWLKGK